MYRNNIARISLALTQVRPVGCFSNFEWPFHVFILRLTWYYMVFLLSTELDIHLLICASQITQFYACSNSLTRQTAYGQETRFCSWDFFHLALGYIYHNNRAIANLFSNELDTHTDQFLLSSLRRQGSRNVTYGVDSRFRGNDKLTGWQPQAQLGDGLSHHPQSLRLWGCHPFPNYSQIPMLWGSSIWRIKVWTILKCIKFQFLRTSRAFDLSIVNCQ